MAGANDKRTISHETSIISDEKIIAFDVDYFQNVYFFIRI